MSKFRFFSEETPALDAEILLSREQSHHATGVLRLEVGRTIELTNGQGLLAEARITQITKKGVLVLIHSVETQPCPFSVELCFGISKGKALDFIVHKCAEIGILSLQPLETQFSLKKSEWNNERWQRVLEEGIKQNQSLFVPTLKPPMTLQEWAKGRNSNSLLFFCDENERALSQPEKNSEFSKVELLVGSEGGFSEEERNFIRTLSPHFLSLGSNRLRSETATLVACVLAKKFIGEL